MAETHFFCLDGPLDSMPTEQQMRIANLSGLPALVRDRGIDPRPILERHNIDILSIRDPDQYVACKAVVNVLEDCAIALNEPLFGLLLAEHQEPDVFGCVTALCRASSTFRQALESFIDYLPVTHSPTTIIELVENDGTAEIRWCVRTDLGRNSQANYQAVMLNIKLFRQLLGPTFCPSYINLAAEPRNKDIQELERHLACRFHSTKAENAIAFPAELLDHPVASANRLLFKLLGGYLEQVRASARVSIKDRVEDYIRSSLPTGNCSIERCAQKLGMSVRTLQAKLGEAQESFSDIMELQRVDLAKSYLKQEQLSLDDVAANLGYSEQSSFGRAFKRWTGLTPKLYRRNHLGMTEAD